MGCLYAEGPLSKCFCKCGSTLHGLMVGKSPARAYCGPSVAVRCQSGNENGSCRCACKGVNHGLYRTIENFAAIPIINNL